MVAEGRGCSGAGWGENIASVTGSDGGAAETETCNSDSVRFERAVIVNRPNPNRWRIYPYLRLGDGERRRRGGEGERRLRPGEGDRLFLETQTPKDEF